MGVVVRWVAAVGGPWWTRPRISTPRGQAVPCILERRFPDAVQPGARSVTGLPNSDKAWLSAAAPERRLGDTSDWRVEHSRARCTGRDLETPPLRPIGKSGTPEAGGRRGCRTSRCCYRRIVAQHSVPGWLLLSLGRSNNRPRSVSFLALASRRTVVGNWRQPRRLVHLRTHPIRSERLCGGSPGRGPCGRSHLGA